MKRFLVALLLVAFSVKNIHASLRNLDRFELLLMNTDPDHIGSRVSSQGICAVDLGCHDDFDKTIRRELGITDEQSFDAFWKLHRIRKNPDLMEHRESMRASQGRDRKITVIIYNPEDDLVSTSSDEEEEYVPERNVLEFDDRLDSEEDEGEDFFEQPIIQRSAIA